MTGCHACQSAWTSVYLIDCDETCLGWGVHTIEGPNTGSIFILAMIIMFASVLATVLWSKLKGDIQGGIGLGALVVAFPPAILTAFLFRLGAISK
ncbi:hypothetical protein BKA56DRAFT_586809 [Ilyonectria sp. MPI-CAGE-AT-0026]|nr:hypothetical protein BKA56DRAFT_586809 [Ilyonectria sp. MPI-CAGE-AT-0026]